MSPPRISHFIGHPNSDTEWAGGVFLLLVMYLFLSSPSVPPGEGQMRSYIRKTSVMTKEATNSLFSSQTSTELFDFKYIPVYMYFFFILFHSTEGCFPLLVKESAIVYLYKTNASVSCAFCLSIDTKGR